MNTTARFAGLITQVVAAVGAFGDWLSGTSGRRIAFRALTDPRHHPVPDVRAGVGWIVIAAAVVGAVAALAGRRALLACAAIVEFAVIADFLVFEAVRRAPGDYRAVDIAWGCWFVAVAALAGFVVAVAGAPRRSARS